MQDPATPGTAVVTARNLFTISADGTGLRALTTSTGTAFNAGHHEDAYVPDYPLLPVRRRFWERVLHSVDPTGTTAQMRTQLSVVHEAADEMRHHVWYRDALKARWEKSADREWFTDQIIEAVRHFHMPHSIFHLQEKFFDLTRGWWGRSATWRSR